MTSDEAEGRPGDLAHKQAVDRLRLVKPENVGKVLGHSRYWTVPFLDRFLAKCDEKAFDRPTDGYSMSVVAPILALRIPVGSRGHLANTQEKLSWLVRSFAVHGSNCVGSGQLDEAEVTFRHARDVCQQHSAVSPLARAELDRREALLLAIRNDERALWFVERSLSAYEESGMPKLIADTLMLRGNLRSAAAAGESAVMGSARDYAAVLLHTQD